MKLERINYVARIDPFSPSATGGGEAVMSALLRHGTSPFGPVKSLRIITPDTERDWRPDADLTIFADVWNLPNSQGAFDKQFIRDCASQTPFIKFDNAYVDVCLSDYLPCGGTCPTACNTLTPDLYKQAKLCYFVSPLHRDTVAGLLGGLDSMSKTAVLRPTVDTRAFYNRHYPEREIDYLYVAPLLPAKGIDNVLAYLEEQQADLERCLFVGANPRQYVVKDAKYLARLPYDEMPRVMNMAKTFIHIPDWPEPMGRTVIEAALCGCNLVVSDNVGALSFGFTDLADPANYEGAIEEFWTTLEQLD